MRRIFTIWALGLGGFALSFSNQVCLLGKNRSFITFSLENCTFGPFSLLRGRHIKLGYGNTVSLQLAKA